MKKGHLAIPKEEEGGVIGSRGGVRRRNMPTPSRFKELKELEVSS